MQTNKTEHYHGCPSDRGGADAYYHRAPSPHKYPNGTYNEPRIPLTDETEIAEYMKSYNETTDRKEW